MKIIALLLALVVLSGCSGEKEQSAPASTQADSASPKVDTANPDPTAECVEEIFQGQFCLGGTFERFQEKRNIPLTATFTEKGFDLVRYARILPFGVEEEILITMKDRVIVGAERIWKGPSDVIREIKNEASRPWHQMLGQSEFYTEAGYVWSRLKGKGYVVEMGQDPRVETTVRTSSFMIRVTLVP